MAWLSWAPIFPTPHRACPCHEDPKVLAWPDVFSIFAIVYQTTLLVDRVEHAPNLKKVVKYFQFGKKAVAKSTSIIAVYPRLFCCHWPR